MLAKILGILDLLSALAIIILQFNIGKSITLILAVYLIGKGVFFISDKVSIVDIVCGISMIMMYLYGFHPIAYLFVFWLAQKGTLSLVLTK